MKVMRPKEDNSAVTVRMTAEDTARFFHERKERADFDAFDQIMNRCVIAPPIPGDELPD